MGEVKPKGISTSLFVVAIIIALIIGVIAGYFVKPAAPAEVKTETITKTETIEKTVAVTATPPTKKVSLTFWHHEAPAPRVAAFQAVIDEFMREHPNIEVKQEVITWGDAWVKIIEAVKAKNPPDLYMVLPELAVTCYELEWDGKPAIVEVDDLIKELDEKYKFIPSVLEMSKIKGHYWSVPVWTMPLVLLYRPSYLEKYVGTKEPPKNWDELLEYAKKCTHPEEEVWGIALAAAKNLLTMEQVYPFFATVGAKIYNEKGEVVFYSPEAVRAAKYYSELLKYTPPGCTAWSWGEMKTTFYAGKIAMMPCYTTLRTLYERKDFDVAAAPIPPAPDGKMITQQYPNPIVIMRATIDRGNYEAAKEFVRFLLRPDINGWLLAELEAGCFSPPHEEGMKSPWFWSHYIAKAYPQIMQVDIDAIKYASLYGFEYGCVNLGIGDIIGESVLGDLVVRIYTGAMTPEEAVKWAHEQMVRFSEGKAIPTG
ncbi:MAG: sugar ABC transporter substrate-binding protein [Candidatus Methanomethylicaceae archaeon]